MEGYWKAREIIKVLKLEKRPTKHAKNAQRVKRKRGLRI